MKMYGNCSSREIVSQESQGGTRFKRGDQIAYVPDHAKGLSEHKDIEPGFITSICDDKKAAFCRYWSKFDKKELRTTANSERTNFRNLVHFESHDQGEINELLKGM